MASSKPVIHGRDHLPGGADPIPRILTSDSAVISATIPWATLSGSKTGVVVNALAGSIYDTEIVMDAAGGTFDAPFGQDAGSKRLQISQEGIYFVDSAVQCHNTTSFIGTLAANLALTAGGPMFTAGAGLTAGAGAATTFELVNTTNIPTVGAGYWNFKLSGMWTVTEPCEVTLFVGNFTDHTIDFEANYVVYRLGTSIPTL